MRQAGTFRLPFDFSFLWQRQVAIGLILAVALLAFELFNFDTTQYALANLLGNVAFLSLPWATILAVAFCAIDFAGLVRFFSPGADAHPAREVWYLMGAWLLGATMNALMTWWAVSLTLINHEFGNEVLSRSELLHIVPIFVAVLVWLTRILFIGGLTLAGGRFWNLAGTGRKVTNVPTSIGRPAPDRRARQAPLAAGRRRSTRPNVVEAPEEPAEPVPARPATHRSAPDAQSVPGRLRQMPRGRGNTHQRPPMPPVGQRLPLKAGGQRDA